MNSLPNQDKILNRLFADLDKCINDMQAGIPLDRGPEMDALAKLAVQAKENDTRTEDEIIADGVAFIMDTRFGGP